MTLPPTLLHRLAVVLILVTTLTSGDVFAQPSEGGPVYTVRDVETLSWIDSAVFTFKLHVVPKSLANVELLHAYDFSTVCQVAQEYPTPTEFGHAAIIWSEQDLRGPDWRPQNTPTDNTALGAQYFNSVHSAIETLTHRTGVTCDDSVLPARLIATDQPIPNVQPTQRLVSDGHLWVAMASESR